MRVLVTGATGFVGRNLTRLLASQGHEIVALSRRPTRTRVKLPYLNRVHRWYPEMDPAPAEAFEGVDAIVHLAGESISGRWTRRKRVAIMESRITGTRHLLGGLADSEAHPEVLVSASAIGYYGDRGDEVLLEGAPSGKGFLAHVCRRWEQEACEARGHGLRVVTLRTGLVLGRKGGALSAMLGLFEHGLGGPLGSGRQWWSWIHMDDLLGLYLHAIGARDLEGTVNAVSPRPVRQGEFATVLGRILGRPAFVPAPAIALEFALGDFSRELLWSRRVMPRRALQSGFAFGFSSAAEALADLVGKPDR